MFSCVGKLPGKIGIIDTSDGVIEWISVEKAKECIAAGIDVVGYENGDFKKGRCKLDSYEKMNWSDAGNIIKTGHALKLDEKAGTLEFKSGKKTYKCKYKSVNGVVELLFTSIGVSCQVPADMFMAMEK